MNTAKKTIVRKKSGYPLGIILLVVGLFLLLAIFWRGWQDISSSNDFFSAFIDYLWKDYADIAFGAGLRPLHYFVAGLALVTLGAILGVRRRIIPVSGKVTVLLECPFCKNRWKESRSKGWGICPHCGKFVHPKPVKTEISP